MDEKLLQEWMAPIWQGNRVWEEPVCFFEDAGGEIKGGRLLYAPEEMLQLTNHDATIVYELHKDYQLTEHGIRLTEGSRIPILKRENYCSAFQGEKGTEWLCLPGREEMIHILPEVYKYQLLATYTHKEHRGAEVPGNKYTKLPRMKEKLAKQQGVHLVFFGDSITAGWEASGADEMTIDMYSLQPLHVSSKRYPYMPVWAELVTKCLKRQYPGAEITKDNLAAGGSHTQWGIEHMEELFGRVAAPDVVFIGFGMNCMWEPAEVYIQRIQRMMAFVKGRNPDCEFVLYPAMVANPEMAAYQHHNMQEFEEKLLELAQGEAGIAAAPIYSRFRELIHRGKEYYEISGNCVNHPNDFSIRVYAQTIWAAMNFMD